MCNKVFYFTFQFILDLNDRSNKILLLAWKGKYVAICEVEDQSWTRGPLKWLEIAEMVSENLKKYLKTHSGEKLTKCPQVRFKWLETADLVSRTLSKMCWQMIYLEQTQIWFNEVNKIEKLWKTFWTNLNWKQSKLNESEEIWALQCTMYMVYIGFDLETKNHVWCW